VVLLSSYLDQHLAPDQANLPAVMASTPMQNYLRKDREIGNIMANYHQVMNHSRQLLRLIDKRLAE
jgi:hypothetical protein